MSPPPEPIQSGESSDPSDPLQYTKTMIDEGPDQSSQQFDLSNTQEQYRNKESLIYALSKSSDTNILALSASVDLSTSNIPSQPRPYNQSNQFN